MHGAKDRMRLLEVAVMGATAGCFAAAIVLAVAQRIDGAAVLSFAGSAVGAILTVSGAVWVEARNRETARQERQTVLLATLQALGEAANVTLSGGPQQIGMCLHNAERAQETFAAAWEAYANQPPLLRISYRSFQREWAAWLATSKQVYENQKLEREYEPQPVDNSDENAVRYVAEQLKALTARMADAVAAT